MSGLAHAQEICQAIQVYGGVLCVSLALGLKCMLKSIHPLEQRIDASSSYHVEDVSWV